MTEPHTPPTAPADTAVPSPPTIAFQGWPGAHSDLACRNVFPDYATLPCVSFEGAFAAVHEGRAGLAMIPVDNSVAGRVADIHTLLPQSNLYIIGEHFHRVNNHLLGVPGASTESIRRVHSHIHALGQCRRLIKSLALEPVVHADTAGAAKMVAELGDPTEAAIGSSLAAEIYGLVSLRADIEDAEHNTTRFLVMSRGQRIPPRDVATVTTFVFEVRSVPAALYKALGGFATNGINMTKLESYMVGGRFSQAQFYADVDGHPDDRGLRNALEELAFFSKNLVVLGSYPAHPFRYDPSQAPGDD